MSVRKYVDGKLVSQRGVMPGSPPPALRLESTADLRSFLLQQMQAVVAGELDTERVKNVCALAEQVYKTAKLEIECASMLADIGAPPQPLRLTGDRGGE